jgi:heme A synthase
MNIPGVADHAAPKEPSSVSTYAKFAAQVAVTVLAAAVALLNGTEHPGASDWVNVVIVGLGSVAVLGAGNLSAGVWRYAKLVVTAATAVAVLLQSAITAPPSEPPTPPGRTPPTWPSPASCTGCPS